MNTESFKLKSPVGPLYLEVTEKGISGIRFNKPEGFRGGADASSVTSSAHRAVARKASQALSEYFDGDTQTITKLPLDLARGTSFQQQVWKAAKRIKPGRTLSYKKLAQSLGREEAVRAVANALGKNPVCFAVPCHRVIASDGTLGGFTGGLSKKEKLLRHEGVEL